MPNDAILVLLQYTPLFNGDLVLSNGNLYLCNIDGLPQATSPA